jgi:NAD(P)-dependent dehydrogenase (short-subunit alcohol dehydrogenase family)
MNKKTVLITGASSGIGRAASKYFQDKGWHVVAAMRTPKKETELTQLENVMVSRLDVTDRDSIKSSIDETLERFGGIDVVVNNAGYGLAGPMEAVTPEQIERQYATNVYGPVYVMQAALPHFREKASGVFVNVTSVGGRVSLPFNSLYHGTKFALEGISESISHELNSLGIKVKIVEPGGVRTDFAGRSLDLMSTPETDKVYGGMLGRAMEVFADPERSEDYSDPIDVAKVIFDASTDESGQIRFVAGKDAEMMLAERAELDDQQYMEMIAERFDLSEKVG